MIDQELHRAAEKYAKQFDYAEDSSPSIDFIEGAQWQAERMYSEEDMKEAFKIGFSIGYGSDTYAIEEKDKTCEEWFEQYKK